MTRILFIGDVVGRVGRQAVRRWLPELRERHRPDLVIANGENLVGGAGIDAKRAEELFAVGVDLLTGGNHVWDAAGGRRFVAEDPRVVRPWNLPPGTPGSGARVYEARDGRHVGVVNLLGRVFMTPVDCPFRGLDAALAAWSPPPEVVVVDFHAEATSEKQALARYAAGRVSAVVGTHTHVQTADARILDGTAVITDVGMTGSFAGVIGMDAERVLARFTSAPPPRLEPAKGEPGLCAVLITIGADGRAEAIEAIREGGAA